MEIIWIIAGALLILAGFVGSFLPVIPGPLLSYIGLLSLQLTGEPPFEVSFLVSWAAIMLIVSFLDNVIPAIGAKKYGGSPLGIFGCIVGLLAGIVFFPPIGIVAGPVAGAFAGELLAGKSRDQAFRAAMGSFMGFLFSTLLKAVFCAFMAYYFIVNL